MSEYQYAGFRAVDAPVSGKNLEFMERQSSRAEVTPWSFDVEHHYGGFRGNAAEMLRRGYDVHLHYTSFGTRNLVIRLPGGLPVEAEPYMDEDRLLFEKDPQGGGGRLAIEPYYEGGERDSLWNVGTLTDRLVPLRAEILDGDLRPLYLAHLAVCSDDEHDPEESREAPVPAGLGNLTPAQRTLAEFFGLEEDLLAAAAEGCPPLPVATDRAQQHAKWLRQIPADRKNDWLMRLLAEPHSTVRAEMLTELRQTETNASWPTVSLNRTIAELYAAAEAIKKKKRDKAAADRAREKAKQMAVIAADPAAVLKETEELARQRGSIAYRKIASLLVELRESLAGSELAGLAEQQAEKLTKANPTRRTLLAELRREGFVPKKGRRGHP